MIFARLVFCLIANTAIATGPQYYAAQFEITPKYGPQDTLEYVNVNAPKGGKIKLATLGTFDTLNPFVINGNSAIGLLPFGTYLFYESLMDSARDDQIAQYAHIAEFVEKAPDNTYVIYTIRKNVTFHDGSALTVDDVVFSFNILMKSGSPMLKNYYRDVLPPEKISANQVKFNFKNTKNKELASILGQLPILCKKFWENRKFDEPLLTPPPSTGPYMISHVDPGKSITYKRNPHYWGKDLPLVKGRWNFDIITWDYYRDSTLTLQAFLGGDVDFRQEVKPTEWFKEYNGPTFKSGFHVKEEIKHNSPVGGYGLYFNLRRAPFNDIRVRKALSFLYDFNWINKNLFQGKYKRTRSYFQNTELEATGIPQGQELEILEPFKDQLPPELFTQEFNPPVTDGSGNFRGPMREALHLLKDANYISEDGKIIHAKTREQLALEIIVQDPYHQRIFSPFINNMMKLGIDAKLRIIDSSQYERRMEKFDFDLCTPAPHITFQPGNEQKEYWGSMQADLNGSENVSGLKNPIVDQLIDLVINAPDRPTQIAISKALDRVLQWQYLSIPLFHNSTYWVAYKNRFGHPTKMPTLGLPFVETWWIDVNKDKNLTQKHTSTKAESAS